MSDSDRIRQLEALIIALCERLYIVAMHLGTLAERKERRDS